MAKRKSAGEDRAFELVSLGRASYASKSAIEKLLAHVDKNGLPETYDRGAQYRARKDICRKRSGEYGPLIVDTQVPLEGGAPQTFSVQNPFAFLQHNCMNSEHYAKIMQTALSKYPCSPSSPWRLIIYQDGVDPSDGLAKNHSRKSAVYYWSFVEFDMQALAKEEVWGTCVVARYYEYSQLAGKGASLFEVVLDSFLVKLIIFVALAARSSFQMESEHYFWQILVSYSVTCLPLRSAYLARATQVLCVALVVPMLLKRIQRWERLYMH